MNRRVLVGTTDADYFLFLKHILASEGVDTLLAERHEEILLQAAEWKPRAIVLGLSAQFNLGGKSMFGA